MAQADQTPPRPVLATRQERSRRTLERIMTAAEELLNERDFDALTMADLAAHAGCAVGTVYCRIPNKESLLAHLYERESAAAESLARSLFDSVGPDLEERARAVCRFVVDRCAARRGTIRATTAHLFARPGGDVYGFRRQMTAAFRTLARFLAESLDPAVPAPVKADCEFALLAVCDVAQSRIVFADRSGLRLRYSRRELETRLVDLLLSYLRRG